jgi:hypothetical protein
MLDFVCLSLPMLYSNDATNENSTLTPQIVQHEKHIAAHTKMKKNGQPD